ncbi:MAG: tRNA (adenosine(37)-N6)-threonylcarbamoyltransferase complex dimerization subunit type 1 TsaB [Ruminococcus sp.]|jgi:tRNA threonylcarbamoyladenosine biosynthesis protein TsaB|nr:tRNA (adenosine(37)-N6)-threonylcarbamoyltransferase complex dimerization subunit type 1 TsaB [Ruminococcus sp.]
MKILGLTTSGKTLSVAVTDGAVLAEKSFEADRSHSVVLLPTIMECLKTAGFEAKDLDGIAVDIGPGSYTGIRIGIATAMGIVFPTGIPCCGVSSLEAMAYGVKRAIAIKPARGNLYYAAVFEGGKRLTPDKIVESVDDYPDFEVVTREDFPASNLCFLAKDFRPANELRAAYLEPTKAEKELNN